VCFGNLLQILHMLEAMPRGTLVPKRVEDRPTKIGVALVLPSHWPNLFALIG